ncbi:MAG TPA: flavin reductase family protein [Bacteroidales bacterium]|nr:flavin reductase family protein [Bacteroidales bacterium]
MKERITWKPGTMLYPLPAVMVSCGNTPEKHNIITIAWTGIVNSNPPMCYISVRKSRHSYDLIKEAGGFVINLTNKDLTKATDWCGVRSGKDYDKFKEMQLTPIPAEKVDAPMIKESPLNLECKIHSITELGSHDMFLAEIVAVHGDPQYVDQGTGEFNLAAAEMITYMHGKYYTVAKKQGKFGHSVEGTKRRKR